MAWSRTLGDLVTDVSRRCDVDGYTARHSLASVRRLLIESYQRMRDWMTTAGSKRWIIGPITLDATGAGVVSIGYARKLPMAVAAAGPGLSSHTYERPHIVEAQVGGRWIELKPISLGEIRDYYSTGGSLAEPQAWTYVAAAPEPTAAENASVVGAAFSLIIAPDFAPTGYPVRVYVLGDTTITDGDGTELYLDGPGFEWIIWDTVIKIAARDNDSNGTAQIALNERAKQEQQIKEAIAQESRNVHQRRDVFHGLVRYNRWRRL